MRPKQWNVTENPGWVDQAACLLSDGLLYQISHHRSIRDELGAGRSPGCPLRLKKTHLLCRLFRKAAMAKIG